MTSDRAMQRIAAATLALLPLGGWAFDIRVPEPELSLAVPGVPTIALQERPATVPPGRRILTGRDATFQVELSLAPQAGETSARVCAGQFLRTLVAAPGMPSRDSIYRAPLDAQTFLVIYALGDERQPTLHAHIVSAAGHSHCADAHFSRAAAPGEDIDAWRTTFTSARVTLPAR